jgi:hypothetical protein
MSKRLTRVLLLTWCGAVLAFWWSTILHSGGLFAGSLTVDFRSFWAATQAFLTAGPASVYDMPTLNRIIQELGGQGGAVAGSLVAAPAPYPPPFFLIFAPFALVPPAPGFALWTLFNLALAAGAVWPLLRGARTPWLALLAALLFFPLVFSLYAGQPSGILLFGLAQMYRSLQREQDFRAGLWLGVLLLKPQYAFGLVLVLLLKRRWRALIGTALAGAALALASLALVGIQGLLAYRAMLSSVAGFRSAPAGIAPTIMISWRGFLLNLLPGLTDRTGLLLTLVFSVLTILCIPVLWRGPWQPRSVSFAARMLATMIVTLLAAYHSHIYGASLLLVPGAYLAISDRRAVLRRLLLLGLLAPPLLLLVTGSTIAVALLLVILMTATLAVILTRQEVPRPLAWPGGEQPIVPDVAVAATPGATLQPR